ncbi:Ig-like domain-containing protein [Flagellimonas sediminis]|uniref:Cadherin domain-containing protein n=1 Tax=Flagellimonas sediminis TaxID=2696468 RepID=A0A6I5KP63_9FLAO|nr:Ig-like domain-containing protein [Allomuricauda sediminis]NDV42243.1 hypothetical protein [Allomuricauda sediminis]
MKIRKLLWGALAVTVLWSCDPNEPVSTYVNTAPVVKDHSFSVKEDISDTQIVGTVTAKDEVDHDKITFSIRSNDDDLFEISPSGNLSLAPGKHLDFETAEEHTITIMAHDGIVGRYAKVTIAVEDVEPEPDSPTITLNKESLELYTMDTETLTATVTNAEGLEIVWTSDNEEVATVDENGTVTASGSGTANITAKLGKTATTCTVSVIPNVYVSSFIINDLGFKVATLWKNGIAQELSDGTSDAEARSIFVDGANVYVAGYVKNANDKYVATLWKNGVAQELTGPNSSAVAWDVSVQGDDVFVAGQTWNYDTGYWMVVLWKNGVPTILTDGSSHAEALSLFVDGEDVYVSGYINKTTHILGMVWKNGFPIEFPLANKSTRINSVYVEGSNVYGAGFMSNIGEEVYAATLWKNGVLQELSNGSKNCNAISVVADSSDVYVCGYQSNASDTPVAMLWKNGVPTELWDGTVYSIATSLNLDGEDVYIAGYTRHSDQDYDFIIWKNEVPTKLATHVYGYLRDIFVK